jgi:hypothetical protein
MLQDEYSVQRVLRLPCVATRVTGVVKPYRWVPRRSFFSGFLQRLVRNGAPRR